jgi:hypothetical protein
LEKNKKFSGRLKTSDLFAEMSSSENATHEPIDEILAELELEPGPSRARCTRYDQVDSQLLKNILARDES